MRLDHLLSRIIVGYAVTMPEQFGAVLGLADDDTKLEFCKFCLIKISLIWF